jgi:hypothetical protein
MFKIFKSYIKWKLISIIKDKLMHYSSEKHNYLQRQNEWKYKVYDGKCGTKERFEKEQEEQIRWSNEQWKVNHHKGEAVLEILRIVECL